MKVIKVKNRILKEHVQRLLEGTSNFYYDNVCLLVPDEDYELDNYPEFEDRPINDNRSFPQYPLVDYNDDLHFYKIVFTPGYYEHACIDFVEVDSWEVEEEITYRAETYIDDYAFQDGVWIWQEPYNSENEKEVSREELAKAIMENVFYPLGYDKYLTSEDINKIIDWAEKEPKWALSVYVADSTIVNKIESELKEEEFKKCEQIINQIAKEYGYRKLGVTARFSNGETWYDYVDESLKESRLSAPYRYRGCKVQETESSWVATAEDGLTIGSSRTKVGAEALIDDYLDGKYERVGNSMLSRKKDVEESKSLKKPYEQARSTGQPLNRSELLALMHDKADEWVADGKVTSYNDYEEIERLFRDEISKSANDLFVNIMFDLIKQRFLAQLK